MTSIPESHHVGYSRIPSWRLFQIHHGVYSRIPSWRLFQNSIMASIQEFHHVGYPRIPSCRLSQNTIMSAIPEFHHVGYSGIPSWRLYSRLYHWSISANGGNYYVMEWFRTCHKKTYFRILPDCKIRLGKAPPRTIESTTTTNASSYTSIWWVVRRPDSHWLSNHKTQTMTRSGFVHCRTC